MDSAQDDDTAKIQALIAEIAVKHGVAVGLNDPIMLLHTLNMRLAADSAASQKEILREFQSTIEEVSNRWQLDAKSLADSSLNESLRASKQAMDKALVRGSETSAQAVASEVAKVTAALTQSVQDAKHIAYLNITAGGLVLAGCLIVSIAVL